MKRLMILIMIACTTAARAGTCSPPSTCQPGDTITVRSASLEKVQVTLSDVTLEPASGTSSNIVTPLQPGATSPDSLSFVIPSETRDGTYLVQIKQTPKQAASEPSSAAKVAPTSIDDLNPNEIEVQHPAITAVSPTAAFLDDAGTNQVTVLGTGFRKETQLRFINLRTPPPCPPGPKEDCYELVVDNSRQVRLTFNRLNPDLEYFKGPQAFALTVDGFDTNTSKISLIYATAEVPTVVALVGLAAIVGLVLLLVYLGKDTIKQTFGNKNYLLSALFLDVPTSSYSLSKCQFYAWTAAAALGYLFLAISKSYVQGSTTFPDIPSGLPGILLASVGTMVLSNGISNTKGDKGAGNPQPNLSDFITTGGVVAPDRLQFAVWTIIGVSTFLVIVLKSDPRDINDLPSIPSGFLQLMGISSAGYLAGKLARKPGPTLDAIAISGTPNKLTFQLTGSALSRSASFSIDDSPIYPDTIQGRDPASKLPDVIQADPTAGDPDFARILSFTVTQPTDSWLGGTTEHNFTIINADKQKATLPFHIFGVKSITISGTNATLTITGGFLDQHLIVTYTKPGGQPANVSDAQSITSQDYKATVEANLTGQVTVTVSDTSGVVVTQDVTVGA